MIFQPKLLWYAKKLTHCFQCVSLKYFYFILLVLQCQRREH